MIKRNHKWTNWTDWSEITVAEKQISTRYCLECGRTEAKEKRKFYKFYELPLSIYAGAITITGVLFIWFFTWPAMKVLDWDARRRSNRGKENESIHKKIG